MQATHPGTGLLRVRQRLAIVGNFSFRRHYSNADHCQTSQAPPHNHPETRTPFATPSRPEGGIRHYGCGVLGDRIPISSRGFIRGRGPLVPRGQGQGGAGVSRIALLGPNPYPVPRQGRTSTPSSTHTVKQVLCVSWCTFDTRRQDCVSGAPPRQTGGP